MKTGTILEDGKLEEFYIERSEAKNFLGIFMRGS